MRNPALRLRTNATRHKYDLFCESEPMVGEVKISGGDYQPKNRGLIREAARKLLNAAAEHAGYQKYLLLVVDNRHPDTPLGQWLLGEFDWPRRRYRKLPVGDHVLVRIWDMSGCDLQEPTTKGARDR
ncbi:MAG: hypothetical protein FJ279_26660 [Planctomycetes bacterium]|nr:hypothetical protein [Planctomycetota bacterium]MBM4080374.1 hypothetical protein [Planctomycetota bacterium]